MKKKIIFILILFIIPSIIYYLINIYNNKLLVNSPIETISCILNNKEYSFDIFFDDENLVYKTEVNDNIIIPFVYKSEEEISYVIRSIYENKGAVCTTSNNYDIEIDF